MYFPFQPHQLELPLNHFKTHVTWLFWHQLLFSHVPQYKYFIKVRNTSESFEDSGLYTILGIWLNSPCRMFSPLLSIRLHLSILYVLAPFKNLSQLEKSKLLFLIYISREGSSYTWSKFPIVTMIVNGRVRSQASIWHMCLCSLMKPFTDIISSLFLKRFCNY